MDADAVVDVWSFYDFGFETFDVLYFYPEVSTHSLRSVDSFGIAEEKGVFTVISIETY